MAEEIRTLARSEGPAFPHDDPVARFVVSMWAARHDLEYALELVDRAGREDAPEFNYLARLTTAHLVEAALALSHYREKYCDVDQLLRKLPDDGKKAMRSAQNVISQVGGKALVHSRIHTFHYPSPDPTYTPTSDEDLARALKGLESNETEIVVDTSHPRLRRLPLADLALLATAMSRYNPDLEAMRKQVVKTREAATAFINFTGRLFTLYAREYDLTHKR